MFLSIKVVSTPPPRIVSYINNNGDAFLNIQAEAGL